MSTVANLLVRIGGDISGLEKSLSRASRKMRDTGKQMQRVGRTMTTRITAPLAAVGGMALKTSADFESLQQSMNTLNGSVEEGTRNFERLQEFSATTPFQLSELAEAQNMLQGFGQSADDAFESVSMIGDIAAVASGDIKGIGIAFGQAAAEGRLMTRDVRQLINQGVPAIKLLADTMNVATSDVLDLASQGEISFEILQQAFQDATTEGGMFANGMEKQAQTLSGRFSTMKDNINLALGSVGDTMSGIAKDMMDWIIDLTQSFRELDDRTKQIVVVMGSVAAAAGPVIWILGSLITNVGTLIATIPKLVAGVKALTTAMAANPIYAVGAAIAFVGTRAIIAHRQVNQLKDSIDALIEAETATIDQVNKKITALGREYEKAANVAATIPNMEADDLIDPKLETRLEALVQLRDELMADKLFRQETLQQLEQLDRFMDFVNTDISKIVSTAKSADISRPFVELSNEIEDKIIPSLDQVKQDFQELSAEEIMTSPMTNLPEKMFPPGSLGFLQQSLQNLREQLRKATDPEVIKQLQNQIGLTKQEIAALTGQAQQSNRALVGIFQTLDSVFQQAILHGEKLGNILGKIAKQFASKALINALAMLVTGGSFSVGKLLFGSVGDIVPEMAQGGLAFGPTMAMVGDNPNARTDPEVISPLSKLKDMVGGGTQHVEVEGTIKSDVIHLANARGKNKFR